MGYLIQSAGVVRGPDGTEYPVGMNINVFAYLVEPIDMDVADWDEAIAEQGRKTRAVAEPLAEAVAEGHVGDFSFVIHNTRQGVPATLRARTTRLRGRPGYLIDFPG